MEFLVPQTFLPNKIGGATDAKHKRRNGGGDGDGACALCVYCVVYCVYVHKHAV